MLLFWLWYLYLMVTHNMLRTHDGKKDFSLKNIRFVPALEIIKSLYRSKNWDYSFVCTYLWVTLSYKYHGSRRHQSNHQYDTKECHPYTDYIPERTSFLFSSTDYYGYIIMESYLSWIYNLWVLNEEVTFEKKVW